jgi:hypothetical protein
MTTTRPPTTDVSTIPRLGHREAMHLATTRPIWTGPGGRVSSNQQAQIVETVGSRDLT